MAWFRFGLVVLLPLTQGCELVQWQASSLKGLICNKAGQSPVASDDAAGPLHSPTALATACCLLQHSLFLTKYRPLTFRLTLLAEQPGNCGALRMPFQSAIVSQLSFQCVTGLVVLERQRMASLLIYFVIAILEQSPEGMYQRSFPVTVRHSAGSRVAASCTEELRSITTAATLGWK